MVVFMCVRGSIADAYGLGAWVNERIDRRQQALKRRARQVVRALAQEAPPASAFNDLNNLAGKLFDHACASFVQR